MTTHSSNQKTHALIAGGGLAGSLLALMLARHDYTVEVFERRPDMRKEIVDTGRSINLALSVRGLAGLASVGLEKKVLEHAIAMQGRAIHDRAGNVAFSRYGKTDDEVIYSISRSVLNQTLIEAADAQPNIRYHFRSRCMNANPDTGTIEWEDADGQAHTSVGEVLFGADGAASALRQAYMRQPRFDFSQDYLPHAYKELHMSPGESGSFRMLENALHIWPRGTYMVIALPNPGGSFTCTLFLDHSGSELSFETLSTPKRVHAFFEADFPDVLSLIPDLTEQFFENPTGNLATIRCGPWNIRDKAVLLGDAAHAVVPFYGQGMNCSFEDVLVLEELLGRYPNRVSAFEAFAKERKPDADAIATLALENFVEMRDSTANPIFLLKHDLELEIERHFADFKSKYSMVTFSRIPYSVAHRKGVIQDEVLMQYCQGKQHLDECSVPEAYALVQKALANEGF
jgi:kynurenine 3-monooxygenase